METTKPSNPSNGSVLLPPIGNQLGFRKIRGFAVPYSPALGVGQYFTQLLVARIRKKKPCNTILTGEGGVSKSYTAMSLARYLQPKSFKLKNICMTYAEFMENMTHLPEGRLIMFDEPEYLVGHRNWTDHVNKALVATMRSSRFKVHPVLFPIINKSLLDKVIRTHLVQFHIAMSDRGEGTVYRIRPSQFTDDVYNDYVCDLTVEMIDSNKCTKPWCPSCPDFKTCPLLRAQYERKRGELQNSRYEADLAEAKEMENADNALSPQEQFKRHLYTVSEDRKRFSVTRVMRSRGHEGEEKTTISAELIEAELGVSSAVAGRVARLINVLPRDEIRKRYAPRQVV